MDIDKIDKELQETEKRMTEDIKKSVPARKISCIVRSK
jgi:hypothetical protein